MFVPGGAVWGFVVLDASSKKSLAVWECNKNIAKQKNFNDLFEIEITDSRLGFICKYPRETDSILNMFAGEMCAFRDTQLSFEKPVLAHHTSIAIKVNDFCYQNHWVLRTNLSVEVRCLVCQRKQYPTGQYVSTEHYWVSF